MAISIGEAETEVSRPNPQAFPDLSLPQSFDSQISGSSSFLPLPPSEPPDIRNWFSSYVYESPESSGLPIELASYVDEGDHTDSPIRMENSEELSIGDALGFREKSPSESPKHKMCTKDPELEMLLPTAKDKHEKIYHFNAESLICERSNYDQIHRGKTFREGVESNQSALHECEGKYISANDDDNQDLIWSKIDGIPTKHHEQSQRRLATESNCEEELSNGKVSRRVSHMLPQCNSDPQVKNEISPVEKFPPRNKCKEQKDDVVANGFVSTKCKEISSEDGGNLSSRWTSTRSNEGTLAKKGKLITRDFVLKENRKSSVVEKRVLVEKRSDLADKTNRLVDVAAAVEAPEIPGKWQCPRKSKPDRGPPLKQLRLERWVHRVI